jgi:hypothetical protein
MHIISRLVFEVSRKGSKPDTWCHTEKKGNRKYSFTIVKVRKNPSYARSQKEDYSLLIINFRIWAVVLLLGLPWNFSTWLISPSQTRNIFNVDQIVLILIRSYNYSFWYVRLCLAFAKINSGVEHGFAIYLVKKDKELAFL